MFIKSKLTAIIGTFAAWPGQPFRRVRGSKRIEFTLICGNITLSITPHILIRFATGNRASVSFNYFFNFCLFVSRREKELEENQTPFPN